jgi:hypothetical protein
MNKKLVSALLIPGLALGSSLVSYSAANAVTQSDIDQLAQQIEGMQAGDTKTALEARLAALKVTYATEAVDAAVAKASAATLQLAKDAVAALPAGADKTTLTTTLNNAAKTFAAGLLSVATTSGSRADRLAAKSATDFILVAADKTAAQTAVTALETAATTAADTALTAARAADDQPSLDAASSLVDKVMDNANLLIQVQIQQAQVAVAKAAASGKLSDLAAAQALVDALPFTGSYPESRSAIAANLTTVIGTLQTAAETLVTTAETAKTQAAYDAAWAKVSELPAAVAAVKASLVSRLATVQAAITKAAADAIASATTKVQKAEGSALQADLTDAQTAVSALPSGASKTALQARVTYVGLIIAARTDVVAAEGANTKVPMTRQLLRWANSTMVLSRLDSPTGW